MEIGKNIFGSLGNDPRWHRRSLVKVACTSGPGSGKLWIVAQYFLYNKIASQFENIMK